MYTIKSKRQTITVGRKTVNVDSELEARVIRWLDKNGYAKRWNSPDLGIHLNGKNYTPDLELCIELNGKSHIAIVEIKPSTDRLTPYIIGRMQAIATHYYSDVLLLYAEKEKAWYRISLETGALEDFGRPIPGRIPIKKMYRPRTIKAKSVYSHNYVKRRTIGASVFIFIADALQELLVGKPKRRRKRNK